MSGTTLDEMFDSWTILHFMAGVISVIVATGMFRWFKVSNALPWAFASSLLVHSVYETKDILRLNPRFSNYYQGITEYMFGEYWARRKFACTVPNAYCDQFAFVIGVALGLYTQTQIRGGVVASVATVLWIILYVVLVFVSKPQFSDTTGSDDLPPEKYSSLYDLGMFYIVWAALGSLGTYLVYKHQDALRPVGWAKK